MPVRSLSSPVLKWPDAQTVIGAAQAWSDAILANHPSVQRIGMFGSYARGDWGVGSDLDLVVIVDGDPGPFLMRPLAFDTISLPVACDLIVYTVDEWTERQRVGDRFAATMAKELRWLAERPDAARRSG